MDVEVLGLVFRRKALGFLPGRVAGDIGRLRGYNGPTQASRPRAPHSAIVSLNFLTAIPVLPRSNDHHQPSLDGDLVDSPRVQQTYSL
jgi:hypothetical protein